MPYDLRAITFQIGGRAEVRARASNDDDADEAGRIGERVGTLNREAPHLADKIERELKKHLPPTVVANASIQFETGSLIITATVSLLSWGGAIVVQALKDEAEEHLKALVRSVLLRVLQPSVSDAFGAIALTVETAANDLITPPSTERPAEPQHAAIPRSAPSPTSAVILVLAFLAAVQILMLADRFLDVRWKAANVQSAER